MVSFIRKIQKDDVGVLSLLSQLSDTVDNNSTLFEDYVNNIPKYQHTLVIELDGAIVGVGTIFIEKKLIHSFGNVGHIEDIVIDRRVRGKGYGKLLIQNLIQIANSTGCYKCILNCSTENIPFYKSCGFTPSASQLSIRFTEEKNDF